MGSSDNSVGTANFIAPTGGVTAGTQYLIGNVLVLAMTTAAATVSFVGKFLGAVHNATKVGSEAWAVGDAVYWDGTNNRFTKASTGNTLRGFALSIVGSGAGATTGDVFLNGNVA